jgi:hypothetical protein
MGGAGSRCDIPLLAGVVELCPLPDYRAIGGAPDQAVRPFPVGWARRKMAGIESIHAFEGTETIQTLIVGRDITGVSSFS